MSTLDITPANNTIRLNTYHDKQPWAKKIPIIQITDVYSLNKLAKLPDKHIVNLWEIMAEKVILATKTYWHVSLEMCTKTMQQEWVSKHLNSSSNLPSICHLNKIQCTPLRHINMTQSAFLQIKCFDINTNYHCIFWTFSIYSQLHKDIKALLSHQPRNQLNLAQIPTENLESSVFVVPIHLPWTSNDFFQLHQKSKIVKIYLILVWNILFLKLCSY